MLTTKQAAELCGLGVGTLCRWSREGLAPRPIRLGTAPRPAVRYQRAAIEDWVAQGCPECPDVDQVEKCREWGRMLISARQARRTGNHEMGRAFLKRISREIGYEVRFADDLGGTEQAA